jgi:hypothetical protein
MIARFDDDHRLGVCAATILRPLEKIENADGHRQVRLF